MKSAVPSVSDDACVASPLPADEARESDKAAVAAVPKRIVEAWANYNADMFAATFTDNGSLILPGDVYLRGSAAIGSYMAAAFAGPYKGTQVFGQPLDLRFLAADVAVLTTYGGVLVPGETEVAPERAVRAMWVVVKQDGEWKIAAYQNTPVNGN